MEVDGKEADKIDDKYGQNQSIKASQDDEDDDKRDEVTRHRENFLNIYKENNSKDTNDQDETDLSQGIKFKRDQAEDDSFQLKTSADSDSKKPLI